MPNMTFALAIMAFVAIASVALVLSWRWLRNARESTRRRLLYAIGVLMLLGGVPTSLDQSVVAWISSLVSLFCGGSALALARLLPPTRR